MTPHGDPERGSPASAPPRVLVTGGAGFIGGALARALAARGHDTVALDDLSTGAESRLTGAGVRLARGDVRDPATVRPLVAGVDTVFHLAALSSVPRSIEDPASANEVNIHGTVVLLDEARKAGVRRFVFASSSAVYGDQETMPITEDRVGSVITPYAVTKLACEAYLAVFARLYGIDTVSLRYFNVYGEGQTDAQGAVVPRFVGAALRGEPPVVDGDGLQTRDLCHVDDAVRANLMAMDATGRLGGEAINVGTGVGTTMRDLASLVARLAGVTTTAQAGPPRTGDIRASIASIDKATARLGYRPEVALEDGLRRVISRAASR